MIIDDKLLGRLEALSAIKIEESKKEEIKAQLGEILDFVKNLDNVDLPKDIAHKKAHTPLRDDVVVHSNVAKDVLDSAPKAENGFFIVPKIVE